LAEADVAGEDDFETGAETLGGEAAVDAAAVGLWLVATEVAAPQEEASSASAPKETRSGSLFVIMHLLWTFSRRGVVVVGNHGELRNTQCHIWLFAEVINQKQDADSVHSTTRR
jgi:hypothetical protein